MKIIKKDLKKQEVTLKPENLDDIWTLSQIIEVDDIIKGRTERKIKIGGEADRNAKVVRKQVFLAVKAEKVEITQDSSTLKVLGLIVDSPEDVPRGEHHSFNLEVDSVFKVQKERWMNYQLDKLNDSTKGVQLNLLMVVFDREDAYFAKLKGQGYEMIGKISGDVQKKEERNVSKDNFYKEISKKIEEYDKDGTLNNIILASPGFWKETLIKILPDNIKKKSVPATISQAGERAMIELLKRDELKKVLEQNRGVQELKLVDKLLQSISKDGACYGLKETKEKVNLGAVKDLLISYSFLQKSKEKDQYKELEQLMLNCEKMDGKIHIISSEEAEKGLNSLTGIAGILRWKN